MISIRQPLCFSEIGKKENQEDFLFPSHADTHTRIFILCDGMGGHDNGEAASKTAATALGSFLSSYSIITPEIFEAGLSEAYDTLDSIDTNSAKKPGTTMTCLCLNYDSYLVAHIGDSRIYHIRPSLYNSTTKRGGILYQSSDHSLVNDLLKAGVLTEEEARNFPQKNIITRAMQPHLQRRYKADIFMFDNIEAGDYFFICCDGVLEQLDNDTLCEILANPKTDDKQKLAKIKSICDNKTRDNYTCWLIPVDKAEILQKSELSPIIAASLEETISEDTDNNKIAPDAVCSDKTTVSVVPFNNIATTENNNQHDDNSQVNNEKFSHSSFKGWLLRSLYFLLAIIVIICLLYIFKSTASKKEKTANPKIENIIEKTNNPKIENVKEQRPAKDSKNIIFIAKPRDSDSNPSPNKQPNPKN